MGSETKKLLGALLLVIVLLGVGVWCAQNTVFGVVINSIASEMRDFEQQRLEHRATLSAVCPFWREQNVQCVFVVPVTPTPSAR